MSRLIAVALGGIAILPVQAFDIHIKHAVKYDVFLDDIIDEEASIFSGFGLGVEKFVINIADEYPLAIGFETIAMRQSYYFGNLVSYNFLHSTKLYSRISVPYKSSLKFGVSHNSKSIANGYIIKHPYSDYPIQKPPLYEMGYFGATLGLGYELDVGVKILFDLEYDLINAELGVQSGFVF